MNKAQLTQKLLNEFPGWSNLRQDEQSFGGQLINIVANKLEDLHLQLRTVGKNYFITTANQKDIDVVSKMQLPLTKQFAISNVDPNNISYIPPTVSGLINNTWHNIIIASGNNIETFWYTRTPNRLSATGLAVENIVYDNNTNPIYGGVASFQEFESPLITISGIDIDLPKSKLWIETIGGTKYLDIDDQGIATRGSVTITGTTRRGQLDSETLFFIHDEIQQTNKEWANIERIDINNIDTDQTLVRVLQHRFGRNHSPQLSPPLDSINLFSSSSSKEDLDLFWDIGLNTNNISILNLRSWQVDELKSRVAGFLDLQTIRSFELLATDSNPIGIPVDIATEPFSNRIWVADQNNIYIYNNELSIGDMRILDKKNFGAMSIIEASTYHTTLGEDVGFAYTWLRPISDIVKHRLWVQAPNGTKYSILNGVMVALDLDNSWIFGSPTDRQLRAPDIFTLNQRGDWLFSLEVLYRNEAREIDQRIVSVDSKIALASFSLSDLVNGSTIEGLDFDSDQNLWILINTSNIISKLKIKFHFDVMLVDFENKVLFFHEQYEQVKVL